MAKSYSRAILAGLAGFAAGVAVGVLFAPDKGTQTRKKLKKDFNDLADQLQDEFSDEIDGIKSVLQLEEEEEVVKVPSKRGRPKKQKTK